MECHAYKSHLFHQVEKSEEEKKKQRQRNLLLLIWEHLKANGYLRAATQLKSEVGAWIDDFQICDNVNLEIVMQDFEAYYFMRYRTNVQLVKKANPATEQRTVRPKKKSKPKSNVSPSSIPLFPLREFGDQIEAPLECNYLLQPLGPYSNLELNSEWRVLAEIVCKEIKIKYLDVSWENIIGHESVKQALKEALVYPVKYPDLYSIVNPWRGLFLYGPTGTGKTMLAKATASQCEATFFNVSPSVFTSKWRGESEKMVKVLFDLAAVHSPSVIFLDEVDCLMSSRFSQEHEASRRFKSELLSHIDGLTNLKASVFIFAASNFPWDIDIALLRRMEQRLYVPLPNMEDRANMLKYHLPPKIKNSTTYVETSVDYERISYLTAGYSGADLHLLSKEVKMQCIRNAIECLELSATNPCDTKVIVPVISTEDVEKALIKIKPIHATMMKQYEEFSQQLSTT